MPRVKVDPTRDHVYYEGGPYVSTLYRFNTQTGKLVEVVKLPYRADETAFGPEGLVYVRSLGSVGRYHPITWNEVPFDYGVHVLALTGRPGSGFSVSRDELIGGLKLYDEPGAKGFQDGIRVSLSGEVSVLSNIYNPKRMAESGHRLDSGIDQRLLRLQQLMGYRPIRFPGRGPGGQATVWVFTSRGELKGKDVVPGMQSGSCGVATDVEGNVYVGFAGTPAVAGKPFLKGTGALVKFPPTGGKFLGDWGRQVPLTDVPLRPNEFFVVSDDRPDPMIGTYRYRKSLNREEGITGAYGYRIWAEGALWAYPGLSSLVPLRTCTCPNNRFALDYYARSFIPETYRFSVGVCDTNGNKIVHIGRYGNEDSRGPGSPVSVGGDEIAFAFPCLLTVKDGELYVSDSGNDRMVQVLLDYHVEETLSMPGG